MEENEQEQQTEQEQVDDLQDNEEQGYSKEEESLKQPSQKQQKSGQKYMSSAEAHYEQGRNVSGPNFGFYDSKNQSEHASRRESTFNNNNQSFPSEKVNINDNESSFSEFS